MVFFMFVGLGKEAILESHHHTCVQPQSKTVLAEWFTRPEVISIWGLTSKNMKYYYQNFKYITQDFPVLYMRDILLPDCTS